MVEGRFKETEIGLIPEDWKVKKIGDICNIRRGASPRPIHDYISTNGIPWVKIADATAQHSRYIEWTKEFISEEGRKKTVIVKPGDLILSNSATPGLPKFLKIDAGIHDGWLLLDPKMGFDKDFIYYMLVNERPRLVGIADGSVFRNLKTDIVRNHKFALPNSDVQSKIANILVNFDNKIEINQKMNQTLEKIGQAIFKHWFVHFEFPNKEGKPYKSSGGEMVNSDLGEIPEGWEVVKVADLIELVYGKGLTKNNRNPGEIPVFGSNGITDYHNESYVKGPGLIIGRKGTVGKIHISYSDFWPIDTTYFVKSKIDSIMIFWYYLLNSLKLEKMNVHSAVPGLNRNDIYEILVLKPKVNVLLDIESQLKSLFDKINQNNLENIILSQIRDSLLPKLMSGKIRVI